MRSFNFIIVIFFSLLLPTTLAAQNLELLNQWIDTTCEAVHAQSDTVFYGNDGMFQMVDFTDPQNPVMLGNVAFPDTITAIAVKDSLAYLGTRNGKLVLVHLHNWRVLGTYQTSLAVKNKVTRIAVHGGYAYLMYRGSSSGGFRGIAIINVMDPIHLKESRLLYRGGDRDFHFKYPYIFRASIYYLFVLNISNDPTNPEVVNQFETESSFNITSFAVQADTAYLLVGMKRWLVKLDISDPLNLTEIGKIGMPTYGALKVHGSKAFVRGRQISVYDIALPDTAVFLHSFGSTTLDIAVHNARVYGAHHNDGLDIWDISNLPEVSLVRHPGKYLHFNSVVLNNGLTFAGFEQSSVSDNFGGLWVMDFWSGENPKVVATYDGIKEVVGMVRRDSLLFVADYEQGLRILNISDPDNIREISFLPFFDYLLGIQLAGDYVYIPLRWYGVAVVNISDANNPVQVVADSEPLLMSNIVVEGSLMYLAVPARGVEVVDISDPLNPRQLGRYFDPEFSVESVAVEQGYVYVASGINGITIVDATEPTQPKFAGNYGAGDFNDYSKIAVQQNFVFVSADRDVVVLDVSNKQNPVLAERYYLDRPISSFTFSGDTIYVAYIGGLSILRNNYLTVNVTTEKPIPTSYHLYQNYPNPFNPETNIQYELPWTSQVTLKIFNLRGEEIVKLKDAFQNPGIYNVSWDGKDSSGKSVASGIYFSRIEADKFTSVKKMMLLK